LTIALLLLTWLAFATLQSGGSLFNLLRPAQPVFAEQTEELRPFPPTADYLRPSGNIPLAPLFGVQP
jgi:hypothetical protein